MNIIIALLCALLGMSAATAYPSRYACSSNGGVWNPGDICNCQSSLMGTKSNNFASGGGCTLVGVPAVFNPCFSYNVQITSTSNFGHKISATAGTMAAGAGATNLLVGDLAGCYQTQDTIVVTSSSYVWTAPAGVTSGPIIFSGLCGAQNTDSIYAANTINSTMNATASTFPSGCPTSCVGPSCPSKGNGNGAGELRLSITVIVALSVIAFSLTHM